MIKIFLQFKAQYLKTQMEYTANFWMLVFAGIIMRTLIMGVVFVLYRNIPDIAGWREGEIYLILGFMFASEGIDNLVVDGVWSLPSLVFRGEFDVMLSRPVSPLYQLLSYDISLQGIGVLAMGFLSTGIALISLNWVTPLSILLCLFFMLSGATLRLSYNLIGACNVFWFRAGAQANIPFLLYSIGEYAKYPVTIYPGWMRFILLFVIPAGFVGYVPVLIIRGEHVFLYTFVLLAVTCLYFLLARAVFYRGIRKYESAGM
ncbi:MAG: ABC-2 family transporter protein [Treponema sp.]|nr:ABC-2 family transporter protein [Treponema sp.]